MRACQVGASIQRNYRVRNESTGRDSLLPARNTLTSGAARFAVVIALLDDSLTMIPLTDFRFGGSIEVANGLVPRRKAGSGGTKPPRGVLR